MNLTPRLQKIASLVPVGSVVADIGTDHAYIPTYCVLNGVSPRAYAMDVNEGPLLNAKETTLAYGVTGRVELRLSNGLQKLMPGEADAIVIAGMGGLLIKSILEEGSLKEGTLLILQPMLAIKELREYLYKSGFGIENEYLAKEDEKIYNIIVARVGYKTDYVIDDILVGRNIQKNSPELFCYYKTKEVNVRNKILNGLKSAKNPDKAAIENITKELERWQNQ